MAKASIPRSPKSGGRLRWLVLWGLALLGPSLSHAAPPLPLAVVHIDAGYVGEAFALSPDGSVLYYVATDGRLDNELRAAELRPRTAGTAGLEVVPLLRVPGLAREPTALLPLPDDRVLVISGRPPEGGEPLPAVVYSPRVPPLVQGTLGPANDYVVTTFGGRPALLAASYPDCTIGAASCEAISHGCEPYEGEGYSFRAFSLRDLRPIGQHHYLVRARARSLVQALQNRDQDPHAGEIMTSLGRVLPAEFRDDYQTLVFLKDAHPEASAGKRTMGLIETLTGRVKRTFSIARGPTWEPWRGGGSGRAEPFVTPRLNPARLLLQLDAGRQIEVKMPRGISLALSPYGPIEFASQFVRPPPGGADRKRLLFSTTIGAPYRLGDCALDRSYALFEVDLQTAEARYLMELPRRVARWAAVPGGRLAVLRINQCGPCRHCCFDYNGVATVGIVLTPEGPRSPPPPPPPPPSLPRDTQLEIYNIGP